jgi:hypothetical protein
MEGIGRMSKWSWQDGTQEQQDQIITLRETIAIVRGYCWAVQDTYASGLQADPLKLADMILRKIDAVMMENTNE